MGYQERAKVVVAVETILESRGAGGWITTTSEERIVERYHQEGRGRPSEKTRYTKEVITRFDLKCELDHAALASAHLGDGVFPLITNDRTLTERELLLVESLLERELRQAMVRRKVESLRLCPEGRACRHPTVRRLIEVFEDVQRHRLKAGAEPAVMFATKLSPLQRAVLRLLGIPRSVYDV